MMIEVPKITISHALKQRCVFIDVRSPKEFDEFHIPNAINIPIFTNEERAKVGTIYKQKGKDYAIELGLRIVSPKLPDFFERLKAIQEDHENETITVYCWRGGMRSASIVSTICMLGLPVLQLEGGIRSYRRIVVDCLEQEKQLQKPFIVIEGHTGTKKTQILERLQTEGYPVVDLEGLARHRGSAFGAIGLNPASQKEFESGLYERLSDLKSSPYYIIEAESKRIGRVILPEFILYGKEKGRRIRLSASTETRIKTILETYPIQSYVHAHEAAIARIKKGLSPETYERLLTCLQHENFDEAISILLTEYYDPRYAYMEEKYDTPVSHVFIDSLDDGVEKVKDIINEMLPDIEEQHLNKLQSK